MSLKRSKSGSIELPRDERQLFSQIADGDHHAFKLFYNHYRPLVYNFALKYLRSSIQAEEAVQEIFLKVWRQGTRLKEISRPEHYLMSVSRNRCIDVLRQMRVETIHMQQAFEKGQDSQFTNETEEQILLKETRKILETGIALLPPQQKLVYTLCHTHGQKQNEVAKELRISVHTVNRHMKLALKFLRDYMSYHTDLTAILIILKLF